MVSSLPLWVATNSSMALLIFISMSSLNRLFSSTSRFIRFSLTALPMAPAMRAFSLGMMPGVKGTWMPMMYLAW